MAQSQATLRTMHVNQPLSMLSLMYKNSGLIGQSIFPLIPVQKESGLYFVYGKDAFRPEDDYRADGAPAREVHYTLDTETYTAEEHALKDIVTTRMRANADKPLDPDADTVYNLTEKLLLGHEKMVASILADTNNYPATGTTHVANVSWAAVASVDPRADIYTAKQVVYNDIHKWPNTITIPAAVATQLSQVTVIDELRKYTDPTLLTDGGLPPKIFGLKVLEASASYLSSAEGIAEAVSAIYSDYVWIGYVNPQPTGLRTMTWGLTFQPRTRQTQKWWEPDRGGDMIEVSWIYVPKVVCKAAGYLLTSVLT